MIYQWLWNYLKHFRRKMILGLMMVLVFASLNMVTPFMTGIIVDRVILNGRTGLLFSILTIMLLVTILKSVDKYFFQMIFERVSQNVIFNVREKLYGDLQKQDFAFFDSTRTGDIMARMTGDMDAVRHFIAWVIYNIFESAAIFLFAMIMMLTINYRFALTLFAVTPVIGYFAYKLASTVRPTFVDIREKFSKLNSVVQENISGNRVVKAFTREIFEINKFSEENDAYRNSNIRSARVWERYLPVIESTAGLLSVFIVLVGGVMVARGTLTLGELVTFNSFIFALNNPMKMSGWLINDVQKFSASAEKIIDLSSVQPKIRNIEKPLSKARLHGDIVFDHVSFTYGDEAVLKDITFSAKAGQTIGIIGPTGSGKSTLVHLICRFYDCIEGRITIDGMDIREMNIHELRENISAAMQDIFLFSDTIEGNIAYGVPHASRQQIEWVSSMADAHGFILTLPEGYDTIIGERGVGLSGGQRQRIALARALLKSPAILILDDTTCSLDIETEQKVQCNLIDYCKDKTTFIIAHRISAVKSADIILVIDKGRIVERGKHEELLKNKGYYYNTYMTQCGDFSEGCTKEER